MPKQISSRTAVASAISGLVLGTALLAQPIAAVADSVVTPVSYTHLRAHET